MGITRFFILKFMLFLKAFLRFCWEYVGTEWQISKTANAAVGNADQEWAAGKYLSTLLLQRVAKLESSDGKHSLGWQKTVDYSLWHLVAG